MSYMFVCCLKDSVCFLKRKNRSKIFMIISKWYISKSFHRYLNEYSFVYFIFSELHLKGAKKFSFCIGMDVSVYDFVQNIYVKKFQMPV